MKVKVDTLQPKEGRGANFTYERVCVWGWPTDEALVIWYKERMFGEGEDGNVTA